MKVVTAVSLLSFALSACAAGTVKPICGKPPSNCGKGKIQDNKSSTVDATCRKAIVPPPTEKGADTTINICDYNAARVVTCPDLPGSPVYCVYGLMD